ncbi:MAG: DNA polymerase IV [Anaerolineaceae bacterium]|jgi:DNA polymerase-4|nr:MAG: DNA polymerase IV [Anaerolineaceae bacterium]
MRYRKILHIDLDAFFCSVEELLNPELKGTVFAVGGSPDSRGVVSSCSYAARNLGIHSAMPMKIALLKAPGLKVVRGHYEKYQSYSERVIEILCDTTPLVEQISIDEAFMDVTDMPQTGLEIAVALQKRIKKETELPCSIGIATNKLVAKIATNIAKSSYRGNQTPCAVLEIPAGKEAEFLAPLPIDELWGIGKKSVQQFLQMGYATIGDLAKAPDAYLEKQIGRFARTLKMRAAGMDDRQVGHEEDIKSISNEITFGKDIEDEVEIERTLRHLSEKVAYRLREQGLSGKTIRLKIRWPDFETHTRQFSLEQSTNHDTVIFHTVMHLLFEIWKPGRKVRLLGVAAANLSATIQQLSILDASYQKEDQLLQAMDDIKKRFGKKIIKRGWDLQDDPD